MMVALKVILLCISLGLLIGGFTLALLALRFRTAQCPPIPSLNPRHWFTPVWMQQSWFQPQGYKLTLAGSWMMGAGACLAMVIFHFF